MQCLMHSVCLPSNRDRLSELFVAQIGQGTEDDLPPLLPLQKGIARNGSCLEFLFPATPGLLAIARQEVREPRAEIP